MSESPDRSGASEASRAAARVPWWRVKVSPARQAAGAVALLLIAAFLLLMYGFGLRFLAVSAISMQPTLRQSDMIIAFPAADYERGEIVILRDPVEPAGLIVKRVIGLPGDTVEVRGGAVLINGVYASEPYRPEPIDYVLEPYTVRDGQVFVLGDNANWSVDSHNWLPSAEPGEEMPGTVPLDSIVGKVRYIYLPPGRSGPIRSFPLRRVMGL